MDCAMFKPGRAFRRESNGLPKETPEMFNPSAKEFQNCESIMGLVTGSISNSTGGS